MVDQNEFRLPSFRRGFHLVTSIIEQNLPKLPEQGVLNLFIHHTSAGLTLNENADPSVRTDFETFINELIPEKFYGFTHTYEGSDDMPAHIKASIIGQSVTIPIHNGRLKLGTWQGIYMCEFRNSGGSRLLTATVYS